jgi:hypothetical protein
MGRIPFYCMASIVQAPFTEQPRRSVLITTLPPSSIHFSFASARGLLFTKKYLKDLNLFYDVEWR